MVTTARKVYFDKTDNHWVAEVDGPGGPVVRSASKQVLEDFLDYLDAREQEQK